MHRILNALLLALLCCQTIRSETITPIGVLATSEWSFGIFANSLIDGSGLLDFNGTEDILDDFHDNAQNWTTGWHSGDIDAGLPGGLDDDGDLFTVGLVEDQLLEFDLGSLYTLTNAHIWQQNQSGQGNFLAPDRGVDEFEFLVSESESGDDFASVGVFSLEPEEGVEEVPAQVIALEPVNARRVRFDIQSALSGNPNEFVGLAEVRFEGTLATGLVGDFNLNGSLDFEDINTLTTAVFENSTDAVFDLTGDGQIDQSDRTFWVNEIAGTFFGDSNLDGEFNSSDFVAVFAAGEYEDNQEDNSVWQTGDWNGDREFDSTDFVTAFREGAYETGPRNAALLVPEPNLSVSLIMLLALGTFYRRRS